jgi:hypothetical protein
VAATLATSTVSVHQVAYLRKQHYSPGFAATWTGLIGAMSVTGRILLTVLGRRWALAAATAVILTLQALAVAILLAMPGPAGVVAFVVLFGLALRLISLVRAALVAELYGVAAYPGRRPRGRGGPAHHDRELPAGHDAVALCSVAASLAMARAHRLQGRRHIPSAR